MSDAMVNSIIFGTPIVVAVLVLLLYGWVVEMGKRRAEWERRWRIPEGADDIASHFAPRELRQEVIGAFMLVGVGTFGMNQIARLLTLLNQCGLEQMVGSILIVENDAQLRMQFYHRIPPVFHDRIKYGYSEAFSGGMENQTMDWVLDHIDLWGVPIEEAAKDVIDMHLRRNSNRAPSDIFLFVSLGGQVPLGLPILDQIHPRFEQKLIVGFTTLPPHDRLRVHYEELKGEYEKRGVHGWVLEDNLGPDPVTADFGMVSMIVALADAALHADAAVQPNNTFALSLTRTPGAVLVYQVASTNVAGYSIPPIPQRPQRSYVFEQPVVEEALKTLRRIENNTGIWSAALPLGEKGTSTWDIMMISLYPEDLRRVEDKVKSGIQLRLKMRRNSNKKNGRSPAHGPLLGQGNYGLPFASIATVIDHAKPVCPIVVVRLCAVRRGAQNVGEIIRLPAKRLLRGPESHLALPASRRSQPRNLPNATRHNGSNGHPQNEEPEPNKEEKA